ncbi:squalene synthase HpnC [uncultured Hydrogenophaga sp.]|uniref:squalene synthase HpnC n=1 Tax=uncultured Hydrogenophaga sp. TaxID=199683 RepID=UPI00265DE1B2|nr:squalene synthase HpnC [uncultured Hydrogenophaga sp.]
MPLGGEVGHYENFPVASWLCPAALRPAVAAIYHFARTADDIADEGAADAAARLADLADMGTALDQALAGEHPRRWPHLWAPLAAAVQRHALDPALLHDLLDAFRQDVRHTASGHRYADLPELLDYCRRSANPVGRLLLQLYRVTGDEAMRQSDAVCSALQLINFWQDIGRDLSNGRSYLPLDLLNRHGLSVDDFQHRPDDVARESRLDGPRRAAVQLLCRQARQLMLEGAPLVHRLPGRGGWELRAVVQGGLRVLDHIEAIGHRSWAIRVTVGRRDIPLVAWRCLRM